MIVTQEFLTEYFARFNKEYFNNELPKPQLKVTRTIARFGYFGWRIRNRKLVHAEIGVSKMYDFTHNELCSALIHEMIHFYVLIKGWSEYTKNGTRKSHGKKFCELMNEINEKGGYNIRITASKKPAYYPNITRHCFVGYDKHDKTYFVCAVAKPKIPKFSYHFSNKCKWCEDVFYVETHDTNWYSLPINRKRIKYRMISEKEYNELLKSKVCCKLLAA